MNASSKQIHDERDPETHLYMGCRHHLQNELCEAIACYQRAVQLEPDLADAYYNMGLAYQDLAMTDQAIRAYKKSLSLEPTNIKSYNNLGIVLQESGELLQAIQCYQKALEIQPESARIFHNLGIVYQKLNRPEEAMLCFQNSLHHAPNFAKAHNALGHIHQDQKKLSRAITCYQNAIHCDPQNSEAFTNLGKCYLKQGEFKKGLKCCQHALNMQPDSPDAKWLYHLSLPIIYQSAEDIAFHRQRFQEGLENLIETTKLETPTQRRAAAEGIGSMTNFYLPYQGFDDLEEQKKYGQFIHEVMAVNHPQFTAPRKLPPPSAKSKIRVAYVSSFFSAHTVGKLFFAWIANLDRNDFEVYCYHTGTSMDALSTELRANSDRFYHLNRDWNYAARRIMSDRPDVLVYPEIGMHAPTMQLAGLRLAPVQCAAWGHPVTTGMPTIDYFLSSDLMEPGSAQQHYSEKLIRLPRISVAYRRSELPLKPKDREYFEIGRDAFAYIIPQSLFKFHPAYDHIYPRIAREVPSAKFVFISHADCHVTRQYKSRLQAAFEKFGLTFTNYCRFVPRLNVNDYLSLNLACDVFLDTPGWSGGHTTLEAIGCGLPVVTCPGEFMRGRHSYAMLKMMGIDSTIAADENDYVQIAARLALDDNWYSRQKQKIANNKDKLLNDDCCIAALENFYRAVVANQDPDPENPNVYVG